MRSPGRSVLRDGAPRVLGFHPTLHPASNGPVTDDTDTREHIENPNPDYVRRNLLAIVVVLVFTVLGAWLGNLVAPDIPRWRSGLAGAMLGAFSGAAGVLNRFLD